jgi:hypothetical protein
MLIRAVKLNIAHPIVASFVMRTVAVIYEAVEPGESILNAANLCLEFVFRPFVLVDIVAPFCSILLHLWISPIQCNLCPKGQSRIASAPPAWALRILRRMVIVCRHTVDGLRVVFGHCKKRIWSNLVSQGAWRLESPV